MSDTQAAPAVVSAAIILTENGALYAMSATLSLHIQAEMQQPAPSLN
jgi:hypothetical protein